MRLPFFGGAYKGPSVEANPQECINLIAEIDQAGGLDSLLIRPGLTEIADLSVESLQGGLITNGDFDTDSDWTKETSQWTISGGKLRRTPGNGDPILGPELLTNGELTTDLTGWTAGSGWTYTGLANNRVNFFSNTVSYSPLSQSISIGVGAAIFIKIGQDIDSTGIRRHYPSGDATLFPSTSSLRVYLDGEVSAGVQPAGAGDGDPESSITVSATLTSPDGGGALEIQAKGAGGGDYAKFGMTHVSAKEITGYEPQGADYVEQVQANMVNGAGSLVEGATYRLTFTVVSISGGYFVPSVAGTNGTAVNATGDYSMDIVAGASGGVKFSASVNLTTVMDDISIQEIVTPADSVRGLRKMGDYLYVVHGDQLKRLDADYTATTLTDSTTKLSTKTGPVTMAHINNASGGLQLMINDGSDGVGYLYDTTTGLFRRLIQSADDFYGGGSVTAQDSMFISHRPDTDEFYISATQDGLTWDVLDVHTAEARTSNIARVLSVYQRLWALKGDSTEEFYNSGDDPVFQRSSLSLVELGALAPFSPALLDNALLWLAHDRTVRLSYGSSAQIVSTHHISRMIENFSDATDAIGFGFTFNNHSLYVLNFPAANKTLVYDISNGLWYEWQSFSEQGSQDDGRYRANCHAEFNNEDIVGDYRNNKLYKIDQTAYADDGNRIRRMRVFHMPKEENKTIFMHEFELDLNTGSGIASGQGSDPQAMLQISRDGGKTYGRELWTDIGSIGSYGTGAIWRRLGQGREPVFKVTISDPIQDVWIGAYLSGEQGYD